MSRRGRLTIAQRNYSSGELQPIHFVQPVAAEQELLRVLTIAHLIEVAFCDGEAVAYRAQHTGKVLDETGN